MDNHLPELHMPSKADPTQVIQDRLIFWSEMYDSAQCTKATSLFKKDKNKAEIAMLRARMMIKELELILTKI